MQEVGQGVCWVLELVKSFFGNEAEGQGTLADLSTFSENKIYSKILINNLVDFYPLCLHKNV